jgi:hypothetical protein
MLWNRPFDVVSQKTEPFAVFLSLCSKMSGDSTKSASPENYKPTDRQTDRHLISGNAPMLIYWCCLISKQLAASNWYDFEETLININEVFLSKPALGLMSWAFIAVLGVSVRIQVYYLAHVVISLLVSSLHAFWHLTKVLASPVLLLLRSYIDSRNTASHRLMFICRHLWK